MDFLEALQDLAEKAGELAKSAGDMASDVIEQTKIKAKISSEKKAVESEVGNIGKYYYEKIKAGEIQPEGEVSAIMDRIAEHEKTVESLEEALKALDEKIEEEKKNFESEDNEQE